jgi:Mg2+ and Co2+ transporter CorA
MPELDTPYAYPVTFGGTVVICTILYILLRRAKWL